MGWDWIVGPVGVPALTLFLVGVVLEVKLVIFVAAGAEEVDVAVPARAWREVHRAFVERVAPKHFVELAVAPMVGCRKEDIHAGQSVDDFPQLLRQLFVR